MASPAVTAQVHQAFDVHRDFTPAVTLYNEISLDDLSYARYVITAEVIAVHGIGKINCLKNLPCRCQSDAVNIRQRPIHMLVFRKVNSCYTCQGISPLTIIDGCKTAIPVVVYVF